MIDKISQIDLVKEFYLKNLLRDISHKEAVQWLISEYKKRTGKVFADPDRNIRLLFQRGFLIKVSKGVYRYDPKYVHSRELKDFTETQKKEILKRDGYKCVICGKSDELQVDHIKPKDLGGKAEIKNGQTLCATHNFRKKNYKQTETGKKMFIRLYEAAKSIGDQETIEFCTQILEVFEKNNMNGHIKWKK